MLDTLELGYNIAKAPLYYVRSGLVALTIGRSRNSGVYGYNWSSRSYSTATSAYDLYFNAADVTVSNGNNRHFGFPLSYL